MAANEDERGWGTTGLAERTGVIVDPRLIDLWRFLWSRPAPAPDIEALAPLLRMAYLAGYGDALGEEDPGELYRALGIRGVRASTKRPGPGRRRRSARGSPGSSGT